MHAAELQRTCDKTALGGSVKNERTLQRWRVIRRIDAKGQAEPGTITIKLEICVGATSRNAHAENNNECNE